VTILSFLISPFLFIDVALPFILFLLAALTLAGNFAIKSVFDRCGVGLQGRTLCGFLMAFLGIALMTGYEARATEGLIAFVVVLGALAMRRSGFQQVTLASLMIAAFLVPVAIIP